MYTRKVLNLAENINTKNVIMKILGFAGSNSLNSINKQLVKHTLSLFKNHETELLDLNDFEVEIFRMDREEQNGIPAKIQDFAQKISNADLLIVSCAENNGSFNAGFKNIYDWTSRVADRKVFDNKPILLMATSPGGRGGASVLEVAQNRFPRDGGEIKAVYSLPKFHEFFDSESNEILDEDKKQELLKIVNELA